MTRKIIKDIQSEVRVIMFEAYDKSFCRFHFSIVFIKIGICIKVRSLIIHLVLYKGLTRTMKIIGKNQERTTEQKIGSRNLSIKSRKGLKSNDSRLCRLEIVFQQFFNSYANVKNVCLIFMFHVSRYYLWTSFICAHNDTTITKIITDQTLKEFIDLIK